MRDWLVSPRFNPLVFLLLYFSGVLTKIVTAGMFPCSILLGMDMADTFIQYLPCFRYFSLQLSFGFVCSVTSVAQVNSWDIKVFSFVFITFF